ncbi:MAG: hypothetical protein ABIA74_01780 [bacterium]
MKKFNFLFFVFSSLLFFHQIKPQFAPFIFAGTELAAASAPEIIHLAQEAYPILKDDVYLVAKNLLNKIKPYAQHEIYSLYHKKRKFRSRKINYLQDFHPKFNLSAPINNSSQVDISLQQSLWEKDYLSKKQQTIKYAINNLTGNTNTNLYNYGSFDSLNEQNPPKIAFVFSGGGYRAMIMSLGFMIGASQITKNGSSLIDATSYISTLSGSTWFLGLMLTLNNYLQFQPQTIEGYLQAMKNYLKQTVTQQTFWNMKTLNVSAIEQHLLQKFLNNEGSVQPSDLWGSILVDRLFKPLKLDGAEQDITFELARNTLNNSIASPFPLFTMDICNCWPYICMETNPYTTGFVDFSSNFGGFIQTNYFESPFNQSYSQKLFPEESLGSFFGIFGSAYSFGLADILNEIAENSKSEWFKSFVSWVAVKLKLYKDRVLRANVDNFMYNMQGYPLENSKKITVADGGMSMINSPFIPLYTQNRNVDIFIVCDAAGDSTKSGYPELKEMADYAQNYNLPFPSLKNPKIYSFSTPDQTYKISVFEDDNSNIPTIVYFPCYTPESTLKFDYSEDEFEKVCGTIEMMVTNNRTAIIDAIKNKMNTNNWFEGFEFDSPSKFKQFRSFLGSTIKSCVGLDQEFEGYYSIN